MDNQNRTNALILYDCCKPDAKFHTNLELLIIYHKGYQTAEIVARKFDSRKQEDKRIYLNYLDLYAKLEHQFYSLYELSLDQKKIEFQLQNPTASSPAHLSHAIPFNEYVFHIKKENVVDYILQRLNVVLLDNDTNDHIKLELFENVFNPENSAFNPRSSLIVEKPEELHQFEIKHHRQHSIAEIILKDMIEMAHLDAVMKSKEEIAANTITSDGRPGSNISDHSVGNTTNSTNNSGNIESAIPIAQENNTILHHNNLENDFLKVMRRNKTEPEMHISNNSQLAFNKSLGIIHHNNNDNSKSTPNMKGFTVIVGDTQHIDYSRSNTNNSHLSNTSRQTPVEPVHEHEIHEDPNPGAVEIEKKPTGPSEFLGMYHNVKSHRDIQTILAVESDSDKGINNDNDTTNNGGDSSNSSGDTDKEHDNNSTELPSEISDNKNSNSINNISKNTATDAIKTKAPADNSNLIFANRYEKEVKKVEKVGEKVEKIPGKSIEVTSPVTTTTTAFSSPHLSIISPRFDSNSDNNITTPLSARPNSALNRNIHLSPLPPITTPRNPSSENETKTQQPDTKSSAEEIRSTFSDDANDAQTHTKSPNVPHLAPLSPPQSPGTNTHKKGTWEGTVPVVHIDNSLTAGGKNGKIEHHHTIILERQHTDKLHIEQLITENIINHVGEHRLEPLNSSRVSNNTQLPHLQTHAQAHSQLHAPLHSHLVAANNEDNSSSTIYSSSRHNRDISGLTTHDHSRGDNSTYNDNSLSAASRNDNSLTTGGGTNSAENSYISRSRANSLISNTEDTTAASSSKNTTLPKIKSTFRRRSIGDSAQLKERDNSSTLDGNENSTSNNSRRGSVISTGGSAKLNTRRLSGEGSTRRRSFGGGESRPDPKVIIVPAGLSVRPNRDPNAISTSSFSVETGLIMDEYSKDVGVNLISDSTIRSKHIEWDHGKNKK